MPPGDRAVEWKLHSYPGKRLANILVVDDDRNIRRTLAASLESASHQVTVAENAERALELLGPSAPAVVVSDIRMEGMGGLKLLESIKRLNPALPVVMMTAFGSIPDAVEARSHSTIADARQKEIKASIPVVTTIALVCLPKDDCG